MIPYKFRWPVDQHGYTVEHIEGQPSTTILSGRVSGTIIRARGGPPRYYEPMTDHPGLWRRFAESCHTPDGILSFITEFGLLGRFERPRTSEPQEPEAPNYDSIESIYNTAEIISQIGDAIDSDLIEVAANLFTKYAHPLMGAGLFRGDRGRFELRPVPGTLRGALLLQAGAAIEGGHLFRRCKNCPEWFRIGSGAHTSRREFCSDRCRVASARKRKQANSAHHEPSPGALIAGENS